MNCLTLFVALSLAVWKLDESVEKFDVQRIMKGFPEPDSKKENTQKEEKKFFTPGNWIEIENDVEAACCGQIRISSYGKVETMYLFILGEYKQIETKYPQNSFVKVGQPKMFLIQPETTETVWGYTWGVSPSPEARWPE